jgi:LemA protein
MGLIIFLVIVAGIIFYLVSIYNGLVGGRNNYKNAFAQIDVQLQRRYDLIPNLVETAKAYMAHEKGTLEAVTAARAGAMTSLAAAKANPGDPQAMQQLGAAETQLQNALVNFRAVAEAYPDLKANQNMMQLSEELTSTENRVAAARQFYNDSVMSYNNMREVFPNSLISTRYGFTPATPLEIESPEAKKAVKVSFA